MHYSIHANRPALAAYLAWQFGPARAVKLLRDQPKRGLIEVTPAMLTTEKRFRSRRQAERVAASMSRIVGYQEGRLGRPLTGGTIVVTRRA